MGVGYLKPVLVLSDYEKPQGVLLIFVRGWFVANFLKTGVTWLESMRNTHLTESVTYTRVGAVGRTIPATPGRGDGDDLIETEVSITAQIKDFLIAVSELDESGTFVPPRKGDTITWNGHLYEVAEIGMNPCWRYSDDYEQRVRVHTVRSAAAPPIVDVPRIGNMAVGSTFVVS